MRKEKIYTIEEIKKQLIENNGKEYNIIYLKDTYCLLYKKTKFYYIQNEYFGGVSITLYNKIDANTKRQCDYSKELTSFNDLLNYITTTKNAYFKNLKDTHEQKIFFELLTIINNKTIYTYLKEQAGYREKYILNNLDRIEKEQEDKNYNILVFYDKENNYFKINTKNFDRLIVG